MAHKLTSRPVQLAVLAAALMIPTLAACGSDDPKTSVKLTDQAQWCKAVADVDVLLASDGGDDFAATQAAYRKAQPILAQLKDGLEVVDADARGDVGNVIQFATDLVNGVVSAKDQAAAEEALAPIFNGAVTVSEAGAAWILDNCAVDIND